MSFIIESVVLIWYTLTVLQVFLGIGTAYRITKNGGDNGIHLCIWLVILGIASTIPGLGIFLWLRYKDD